MVKSLIRIKPALILITGIITVLFLTGCEQKTEQPGEGQHADTTAVLDQPVDTAQDAPADVTDVKPAVIDLQGKWTGTFSSHSATFTINEQNENEFSGTLNVAFREPMVKYVSGKVNMDAMTFTMRDTRQTRDMGKYSGKITEDGKMNGTFTMEVDGKNFNFSLTKR
ncbi:MAG: hypothetical protein R6W90_07170 [Ignavibacteriaceae bacterium]